MLGEPHFEELMRLHLKSQKQYGAAPFVYLPDEDKMKTLDLSGTRREVLKSSLYLLIITGLWVQMYNVDKSKADTVEKLESVCVPAGMTVLYFAKQSIFQKGGHIVELYNLFAAFEQSCLISKPFFHSRFNSIVNTGI